MFAGTAELNGFNRDIRATRRVNSNPEAGIALGAFECDGLRLIGACAPKLDLARNRRKLFRHV